jgi:tetratricopeptide (TPR) repeat protein
MMTTKKRRRLPHNLVVEQVSKPALPPISKSASRRRVWKPAPQQTWKSALQFVVVAAVGTLLTACGPPGARELQEGEQDIKQGQFAEAIVVLRDATRILSEAPLTEQAKAWNLLGLACQDSGQLDTASKAYLQALKLDRNNAATDYNLGCLRSQQADYPAATNYLTTYITLRPKDVQGYLRRGTAYFHYALDPSSRDQRRLLEKARLDFETSDKIEATAEAFNDLGVLRLQSRAPGGEAIRAAETYFEFALKRDPNFAPALLNLATIQSQQYLNNPRKALQLYQAYLAISPPPPHVEEVTKLAHDLDLNMRIIITPTTAPTRVPSPKPAQRSASPPARVNVAPTNPVAAMPRPPPAQAPPIQAVNPTPAPAPTPAVPIPQVLRPTLPPAKVNVAPTNTVIATTPKTPSAETPPAKAVVPTSAPAPTQVAAAPPAPRPTPPPAKVSVAPTNAVIATPKTPPAEAPPAQAVVPTPAPAPTQVAATPPGPRLTPPPAKVNVAPTNTVVVATPKTPPAEVPPAQADNPKPVLVSSPVTTTVQTPLESSTSPKTSNAVPEPVVTDTNATPRKTIIQRLNPLRLFSGKTRTREESAASSTAIAPEPPPVPPGSRFEYPPPVTFIPGNRAQAKRLVAEAVRARQSEDWTECIRAYKEAVAADPTFYEACRGLGLAAIDVRDYAVALKELHHALALQEDSAEARYTFAWALQRRGYTEDAVHELGKLLEQHPNDVRSHLMLGSLYAEKLKQPKLAREQYTQALELDPNNAQAANVRAWLRGN